MKKKVVIIFSLIIIISVMSLVLVFMKTEKINLNYTEDEITFKDEYEKLNGIEIYENYILKTINIDSDNNIKYVTDSEILNKLTNGTNIIYFGWSDCNWCRSVIPTLIDVVKENNIDKLYYYNFKSIRTAYENDSDKEKAKIYEEIIKIVGKDIISVFDEESLKNGEKKILAPTVIAIKDGRYVGLHTKSVESHINATDELTEAQIKELKNIYQKLINKINTNTCSTDEGC